MLKLSRPLHLLLAALTYSFGASIADYLGNAIKPASFWLGLLGVVLAQLTMSLLPEIFRLDAEPPSENEDRREREILRNNLLYVSVGCLTSLGLIFYALFSTGDLPFPAFYFLGVSLGIILVYSLPPFRFINRGFGELLQAVHMAYVLPSIGFILQAGVIHRFLWLNIPLTFLAFGYFITMDFQSFANDKKYGRITMLTRLGWERVIPLHHIFVLFAYIFFVSMSAFGLTLSLIWPAFLTLPFAVYQIFQLRNITLGLPPNWTVLNITAFTVFGLTVYFLALTFWIR